MLKDMAPWIGTIGALLAVFALNLVLIGFAYQQQRDTMCEARLDRVYGQLVCP
ncbi:hypothetical protein [Pseudomonas mangiferae]|uniref:hypothetical protein n=1 Tax=Pseudomonas mangiferae TaxID=2593654 RepID=UPI0015B4AD49|nr:hypothetical protein [Pseudomonas mangiferae]